ncbi:MAG: CBS domain-containing protein [Deltaproteobacteria bacterium]|nr:CBS domain-containing protein [Deltaproteobacteria bacterium]RLB91174.1 MAG: signal transduction protein [Deltaproteobacteria bacterium]RLB96355.1 MAG: signal transduction protein [Deltaproteobacteria bacterium]RLC11826.1 MAG: signal transduction protein [Deltaproteobacteria bacterium]
MRIRSLMIKKPITISDRTSVQEAIELMQANSIRHLPVVNHSNKLVGLVTLADMKQALLPAMVTGVSLADIMIKNPITIHPDADVETAAQIIYQRKIGGMPVVDDEDKVVGIITVTDILGAFIDIMGILTNGSRLDINVGTRPEGFEKVSRIIHDHGGKLISVGIGPSTGDKKIYYFRIKRQPLEPLIKALQDKGYEVLSFS